MKFISDFMQGLAFASVRAIGLKKVRRNRTRSMAVTSFINDKKGELQLNRQVMQRRNEQAIPHQNYHNIYNQEKRRL